MSFSFLTCLNARDCQSPMQGTSVHDEIADDSACCFPYESDAQMFYESLKKRLAKFKLEVAEDKTVQKNRKHGSIREVEHNPAGEGFPLLALTQFEIRQTDRGTVPHTRMHRSI